MGRFISAPSSAQFKMEKTKFRDASADVKIEYENDEDLREKLKEIK
tara:strand:- start:257 stop:394 length:138 start_codon:yes stop_codon:yes gene_type:complete